MVGSAIQSVELIRGAGAGGKNDDAQIHFLLAQLPDQIKTVAIRQTDVDDRYGVAFRLKFLIEFCQAGGDGDAMAVLGKEVGKLAPQNTLVFQKNYVGHGRSLRIMRSPVPEQT